MGEGQQYIMQVFSPVLIHTVGPAIKEVPESAIAAQPPAQNPGKHKFLPAGPNSAT